MGIEAEALTRHIPRTKEEHEWARWRPPRCRCPLPAVGDRVLYRHDEWAEPVNAVVLEIRDDRPDNPFEWANPYDPPFDPNVWRVVTINGRPARDGQGRMKMERHPDAWPTLLLKVDGSRSHVETREARLRGSPGWLPLDWRDRQRPVPGLPFPAHGGDL